MVVLPLNTSITLHYNLGPARYKFALPTHLHSSQWNIEQCSTPYYIPVSGSNVLWRFGPWLSCRGGVGHVNKRFTVIKTYQCVGSNFICTMVHCTMCSHLLGMSLKKPLLLLIYLFISTNSQKINIEQKKIL